MTYDEFIDIVRCMRRHQKLFFKDRRQQDLLLAKQFEREVDRAIKANPQQATLFGDEKEQG